jgi:hypothetical protein
MYIFRFSEFLCFLSNASMTFLTISDIAVLWEHFLTAKDSKAMVSFSEEHVIIYGMSEASFSLFSIYFILLFFPLFFCELSFLRLFARFLIP